ncbi:hypothetical protein P4O66_020930, partial [Electrophorus voltai]
ALDVGVHSPESKDSAHVSPLVLPPINGSLPLPFEGKKKEPYQQNIAKYKEHQALLQSLLSERDELCQLNSELQVIIADSLERDNVVRPVSTKLSRHCYQDRLKILEGLRLQWQYKSQLYQQQAEELWPQCQEKKE